MISKHYQGPSSSQLFHLPIELPTSSFKEVQHRLCPWGGAGNLVSNSKFELNLCNRVLCLWNSQTNQKFGGQIWDEFIDQDNLSVVRTEDRRTLPAPPPPPKPVMKMAKLLRMVILMIILIVENRWDWTAAWELHQAWLSWDRRSNCTRPSWNPVTMSASASCRIRWNSNVSWCNT